MQTPCEFIGACGAVYERPSRVGFTSVDVLPILTGKPWDEVAIAFIHSLRPSCIRVIGHNCAETTDAHAWRVTVYLDENDLIERVSQEVEVALPYGVPHGHALSHALKYGRNSEQVKWHCDAALYMCWDGKLYKSVAGNDEIVEFPRTE